MFQSCAEDAVANASATRPGVMPPSPSVIWTRGAESPYVSMAPKPSPKLEPTPTPEAPVESLMNGVAGVGCPSRGFARYFAKSGVSWVGLRLNPRRSSNRSWNFSSFGSRLALPIRATSLRSAHIA